MGFSHLASILKQTGSLKAKEDEALGWNIPDPCPESGDNVAGSPWQGWQADPVGTHFLVTVRQAEARPRPPRKQANI